MPWRTVYSLSGSSVAIPNDRSRSLKLTVGGHDSDQAAVAIPNDRSRSLKLVVARPVMGVILELRYLTTVRGH